VPDTVEVFPVYLFVHCLFKLCCVARKVKFTKNALLEVSQSILY